MRSVRVSLRRQDVAVVLKKREVRMVVEWKTRKGEKIRRARPGLLV